MSAGTEVPWRFLHLWRSLTLRVTVTGIGLMLLAIATLGIYAAQRQRADMEQQLGLQQLSTAAYIAATVDRELGLRIDALSRIAAPITAAQMQSPTQLHRLMAERPVFQGMFNAGTYVTDTEGRILATVSGTEGALDSDTADATELKTFLQTQSPSHVFLSDGVRKSIRLAVPVRLQGRTVGALVGASLIDTTNFLQTIASSNYGLSGGYALYAPAQNRIVMASAPTALGWAVNEGAFPDALRALFNSSDSPYIAQGPDGNKMLVSSKNLTHAPLSISVMLPTREAFAVVDDQQRRLTGVAVLFALVIGLATWSLMRRQFAPIRLTVGALNSMARPGQQLQPLPLTGSDEVDRLISGFNHLLSVLSERSMELQRSLALNQNTLDSLHAQIAVLDASGRVLTINQSWAQHLKALDASQQPPHIEGLDYRQLFQRDLTQPLSELADPLEMVQRVLEGQAGHYASELLLHTTAGERWLMLSVTPLGAPMRGAVLSRTDITDRKRADEQLRKLSRVAEQAPLAIIITDLKGNIEYTNPYFTDITGYAADKVLGQNPRIFQSGQTSAQTYEELWTALRAGTVWRGEFMNHRRDGSLLVERATIAPVLGEDGTATHFVALKEDITQAREQERRRLELNRHIEELSRRLVRVQEESRQRFSQELHDRTSPNLAALRINVDIIAHAMEQLELSTTTFDRVEDTRALIEDTTASIREICAGLHPAAVEHGGLLGVVRSYCEQFSRRTGIQVQLRCPHEERRLHKDLELSLFRIIQEALTNSAKHAQARNVEVRLQFDQSPVILSIVDDGCGFDVRGVLDSGQLRGLGLINIQDTVNFARGHMRIDSSAGSGTSIYIEI